MNFEYTVSDQVHKKTSGLLDVSNKKEAIRILKEKGFFIITLKEKVTLSDMYYKYFPQTKLKLPFNRLVDFTRQLGIMVNAGLSLVDALSIMIRQTKDQSQKQLIAGILDKIKGGESFSDALEEYPDTFQNFYIALVKAGESSGKLDDVLLRLAENLERAREFRGKITNALLYPMTVVGAIFVVGFIMATFVLPKLLDLYKTFKVDLPMSTKVLIAVSNFSSQFWPLIILSVVALIIYVRVMLTNKKTRENIDRFLLKLPVFGDVVQKSVLVETTRTLAILLHSGVPLLEGLEIATKTTSNIVYQKSLMSIQNRVERGASLGDALSEENVFPEIFVQMTGVGEKTGKLDDTLLRLSKYFQMESELAIKAATTLIEPLILVFLGVGVGFLVISVLTPIYSLTGSFGAAQ